MTFEKIEKILRMNKQKLTKILQGLGVGPGSATERWPCRKKGHFRAIFRDGQRSVTAACYEYLPMYYCIKVIIFWLTTFETFFVTD